MGVEAGAGGGGWSILLLAVELLECSLFSAESACDGATCCCCCCCFEGKASSVSQSQHASKGPAAPGKGAEVKGGQEDEEDAAEIDAGLL